MALAEISVKNDSKKVLVIDDSKRFCKSIKLIMNSEGFHVDLCYNGVDGINMIRQQHFDVVIVDYIMPDMDGVEVTKQILNLNGDIPIIMVTGNKDDSLEKTFKRAGGRFIFDKIINYDNFFDAIDSVI